MAEQDDEWTEGRRYLGVDLLARCQVIAKTGGANNAETAVEVNSDLTMQALTA